MPVAGAAWGSQQTVVTAALLASLESQRLGALELAQRHFPPEARFLLVPSLAGACGALTEGSGAGSQLLPRLFAVYVLFKHCLKLGSSHVLHQNMQALLSFKEYHLFKGSRFVIFSGFLFMVSSLDWLFSPFDII